MADAGEDSSLVRTRLDRTPDLPDRCGSLHCVPASDARDGTQSPILSLRILGVVRRAGNGNSPAITPSASPGSLSLEQGASGEVAVAITRAGGFAGEVTLTLENVPTGVTPVRTPSVFPVGGSAAAMTFAVNIAVHHGIRHPCRRLHGSGRPRGIGHGAGVECDVIAFLRPRRSRNARHRRHLQRTGRNSHADDHGDRPERTAADRHGDRAGAGSTAPAGGMPVVWTARRFRRPHSR